MSDLTTGSPEGQSPQRPASRMLRGGTLAGVVLVVLGTIMLFGPYLPWLDLFRLWPLIIVVGGVAQIFRPHGEAPVKRVAEGAGSIAVGLVLLGNTFGQVPWTVWVTMLSLWPLLLVALGIELLGKGLGLPWVRAMSNVLLILGLLYGVFILQPGTLGLGVEAAGVPYRTTVARETNVREGTAAVKAGTARVTIKAGSALASVSGKAPAATAPQLKSSVVAGVAEVTIDEPSRRTFVFGVQDRTMELELDRAVKWKQLRLDLGAAQVDADLSDLEVEEISVNAGASDIRIKLGSRAKDVGIDVSSGAANITLRLPSDAAVTLDSINGLSGVNVPPGFRRLSGMAILGNSSWASDGSGGPRIAIALRSGVSNLTIETY